MLSSIFGSSNANPAETKPEPSGGLLGSLLGSITKPAPTTKTSNPPKSSSNSNQQSSKPSANGKSADTNRDEHRIKKKTTDGDKERSRDAEKGRDSYSNRNDGSKEHRNGKSSSEYDPLSNSGVKKELSKPKLDRRDSLDVPIKKKPADPSRRDDSSPKIKKREPSSPIIKKKEPSSLPPKKPEPTLTKRPETSKSPAPPIRKPDPSPVKKPDTSKSPAPRPSGPSSGNSTSRPPQKPSSSQGGLSKEQASKTMRPLGPVAAQARGKELERKLYPGADKPKPIGLKPSSNSSSAAPKSGSGSGGLLSKPSSQRPYSGGSAPGNKPVAKPGSGSAKPSGSSTMVKKPVSGSQPPAKPGIKTGSTGSVPPKTMTGKPLVAAKPGLKREDVPRDRVRPMNAPPTKPGAPNANGKRPNDKGISSRHEPMMQKKQVLQRPSTGNAFKDIFLRGKPKPAGAGRSKYDDEDDDYEKDSFIDDGSEAVSEDPDEEARRELENLFKGYRKKVERRKNWEEESIDNMETGYDDLQMEEDYSRYRGRKEDDEQLKYIMAEAEAEERRKKKKRLQID